MNTDNLLPALIIKNIVLFPYNEIRLEFDNDKDKELISLSESFYNKHILIINRIDSLDDSIDVDNLSKIGIVSYISMKIELPNQKTRIVLRGLNRVLISNIENKDGSLVANFKKFNIRELNSIEEVAYSRSLIKKLEYFIEHNPNMSNSVLSKILGINDINKITDILTPQMPLSYPRLLEYVNEVEPTNRVMMLLDDINNELKIISLESSIEEKVSLNIDKSQKEFILNEKMKVIKEELGINEHNDEIDNLRLKIKELDAPKKIKLRLDNELNRYEKMNMASPEVSMIRNYIDIMLSLPWNNKTNDNKSLIKAKEVLDNSHYGLEDVKDKITEYLATLQYSNNVNSPIICLVGPPGVGKTTFAKAIASALNRKFTKISVGGVNDVSEIIGHRRAYIGSSFGKIIGGMRKAGSKNPVFVIDEIDKMTKDIKGDPASSLLEVLDKNQNKYFVDNYIEEEYDLSNVLFICTANYKELIPIELYDRMEIIEMNSYTLLDKINIAKNYIIPKSLKEYNLKNEEVIFTEDAIIKIIKSYTKEAGVRELERCILVILRKIIKEIVISKKVKFNIINEDNIELFLGNEKYPNLKVKDKSFIGVINAMSYTLYGGEVLKVESVYYKGTGNITTTGSLGDVFKESAITSYNYIKSNYDKFNIDYNKLINSDIHLHVPEGSIKKDGPSAGCAITTSIISTLTDLEIPDNISMTGEITLRGNILPVGGLKEKIISAKSYGIKKIFIPKDNEKDVEKLDKSIRRGIKFMYVSNYDTLYERLLREIEKEEVKEGI